MLVIFAKLVLLSGMLHCVAVEAGEELQDFKSFKKPLAVIGLSSGVL